MCEYLRAAGLVDTTADQWAGRLAGELDASLVAQLAGRLVALKASWLVAL